MKAAEIAGPVLYLLALGLFLSFFVPYVLLWSGVEVGTIFVFAPVLIAVVLYLVSMAVLPEVPHRNLVAMSVVAAPLVLFPNLRIRSTFFDRIAPTLGKLLMGGVLALFAFSLHRTARKMGALGAVIMAVFSLVLSYGVSSVLSFEGAGWVLEPALVSTFLISSLILLASGEAEAWWKGSSWRGRF